jgi:DhnA family fructose-bisphosphate aldolase class Ia
VSREAFTPPTVAWPKRRLHHIFGRDGRAVVVALDAARRGPTAGLEDAARVVASVVAGGVDAVMTTYGMARAVRDALRDRGLIIALDHGGPVASYGVEAALQLGADAVELKAYPEAPEQNLDELYALAAACDRWGMPLLAEMLPVSWDETLTPSTESVERVARAARTGAEAGADFLKVHYVGPPERYRRVVDTVYVPVLIMGGPDQGDPRAALAQAAEAMAAGAKGVVYGRNVFRHPHPDRMVAALAAIVHEGADVATAERILAP